MRDNPIPGLRPALRALGDWFRASKTPFVVIGGVAVGLVARARATLDVDVLVLVDDDRIDGFIRSGESFGFVPRFKDAAALAETARILPLIHEPSRAPVDVIRGGLEYEKRVVRRSTPFLEEGLNVRVPRGEDLIVMKAVASRPIDLADIDMILDMRPDVDRRYIRRWARKFSLILEDPQIAENIERLLSTRRVRLSRKKTSRRKR